MRMMLGVSLEPSLKPKVEKVWVPLFPLRKEDNRSKEHNWIPPQAQKLHGCLLSVLPYFLQQSRKGKSFQGFENPFSGMGTPCVSVGLADACFMLVSGSSPLLSVEDYQDGGIRVGCRAAGWYPKPEMLWRDFQGQQLPSFTESTSQDKNGFFQVEKTIIIHKNSKQNLSCSVQNTRLPQEKDSSIYISGELLPELKL